MVKDKRTNAYLIHLNKKELDMFKLKAKKYKQMSNMIRDAVAQFDDKKTKGWIDSLNGLSSKMGEFNFELSKQGVNLNQIMKRANELIYAGELDKDYYESVFFPEIKTLQKLMSDIKEQQTKIFKSLLKL